MPTVMYCDDEEKFVRAFTDHHKGTDFAIVPFRDDVLSLPRQLENMRSLPDLIVLDLYHTRASSGSDEAREANLAVDEKLAQINALVEELRGIVARAKEPRGLVVADLLRASRDPKIRRIPLLMYTRQGLSLLGDDELRRAIQLRAEWMIKGRGPELERARMHQMIEQSRPSRRPARDVILTVIGALLGTALGVMSTWL